MAPVIAFRTDASLQIGTGHVMRCLTLADAFAVKGAHCIFICRTHPGNLIELVRSKGYVAHVLPLTQHTSDRNTAHNPDLAADGLVHSAWLGATQMQDAEDCAAILTAERPDWMVVDHYALNIQWEQALAPYYRKLMVIDDLADRQHACHLLLDQTFGRDPNDYRPLVPVNCELLCGPQYALLRPEFAALRAYSLQRRTQPILQELLITLGGVDKDNVTQQVLQALRTSPLPESCRITVVLGSTAPFLNEVRELARSMPWTTRVLVSVTNMAQLMAETDLAIGAAGATSWERCCLGVPTLMLVLAENQRKIAQELQRSHAAQYASLCLNTAQNLCSLLTALINDPAQLLRMSKCAASILDGSGVNTVTLKMESLSE